MSTRKTVFPVRLLCRTCSQGVRYNSTIPTPQSSRIYCQNLLYKYDHPSYLQIPFIPQSARDAHLAIRALNVEMALIPETVANQHARKLRMQFWKDALEDCFEGKPKAEPLSILLAHVLASGERLTKSFFQSIISERVLYPLSCPLTLLIDCNVVISANFKPRQSRITPI